MISWYANETLVSQGGDLAVVVYLPLGIKKGEPVFYYGSRFDHSSMIGSVTRKKHYISDDGTPKTETHILYGTDLWRIPHNSHWPESGVGLAAEFGVGDNGAFCLYRCGWTEANDITNGVLGYTEAKNGEPFLKIGVGALIKGSCPSCDSTGDYNFNSPYLFFEDPQWTMEKVEGTVRLSQQVILNNYGYKIVKEIALVHDTLTVTSTLTNLGAAPFSTVWYSHNFFTCDGVAVGPGYGIVLDVAGEDGEPRYEEPDTWSWTAPLADFAVVTTYPDNVRVDMGRALGPGERVKAMFKNDPGSDGGFRLEACGSTVETTIPQLRQPQENGLSMYAFNLYVERGTFSPEPQILLHLDPGASKTWTQRLVFGDAAPAPPVSIPLPARMQLVSAIRNFHQEGVTVQNLCVFAGLVTVVGLVLALPLTSRRHRRRRQYSVIRDISDDDSDNDTDNGR